MIEKFKIEIKWAVIFTLATILWVGIEKVTGLHEAQIDKYSLYTNLFAFIALIIYILALKEKKKIYFNHQMDWKQGFISGVILSVLVAVLSPIAQEIIFSIISPDFFKNIIAHTIKIKAMSPEAAESYFNIDNYRKQGIFGALSMGVVTSAIVAFFIQTKNNKNV